MKNNLPDCPVETTLMLISNRWKVLIIRDLLDGTKRFGDSGLLSRKIYPEVPPRVEYTLTETGYSLKPILEAMVEWGTEYKQKSGDRTKSQALSDICG